MASRPGSASSSSTQAPVLVPQGRHAGKPNLSLSRPCMIVGASSKAHFNLVSPSISKTHAAFIQTDAGTYVRDTASRTKVIVNGKAAPETMLSDGDTIALGSFTFLYRDRGAKARKAAPTPEPGAVAVTGERIPVPIEGRTLLIGRRPGCDVQLVEAEASNCHALIFEHNGKRFIRDLHSRTGTFVNGTAIHQQQLEFDDEIRIGQTDMRYVAAEQAADDDQIDELEDLVGTARLSEQELAVPLAGGFGSAKDEPDVEELEVRRTPRSQPAQAIAVDTAPPQADHVEPIPLAPAASADEYDFAEPTAPARAEIAASIPDEPAHAVASHSDPVEIPLADELPPIPLAGEAAASADDLEIASPAVVNSTPSPQTPSHFIAHPEEPSLAEPSLAEPSLAEVDLAQVDESSQGTVALDPSELESEEAPRPSTRFGQLRSVPAEPERATEAQHDVAAEPEIPLASEPMASPESPQELSLASSVAPADDVHAALAEESHAASSSDEPLDLAPERELLIAPELEAHPPHAEAVDPATEDELVAAHETNFEPPAIEASVPPAEHEVAPADEVPLAAEAIDETPLVEATVAELASANLSPAEEPAPELPAHEPIELAPELELALSPESHDESSPVVPGIEAISHEMPDVAESSGELTPVPAEAVADGSVAGDSIDALEIPLDEPTFDPAFDELIADELSTIPESESEASNSGEPTTNSPGGGHELDSARHAVAQAKEGGLAEILLPEELSSLQGAGPGVGAAISEPAEQPHSDVAAVTPSAEPLVEAQSPDTSRLEVAPEDASQVPPVEQSVPSTSARSVAGESSDEPQTDLFALEEESTSILTSEIDPLGAPATVSTSQPSKSGFSVFDESAADDAGQTPVTPSASSWLDTDLGKAENISPSSAVPLEDELFAEDSDGNAQADVHSEVIPPTDPDPDSAQTLASSLPDNDLRAVLSPEETAALTDTVFARDLSEFSGSASEPIIEATPVPASPTIASDEPTNSLSGSAGIAEESSIASSAPIGGSLIGGESTIATASAVTAVEEAVTPRPGRWFGFWPFGRKRTATEEAATAVQSTVQMQEPEESGLELSDESDEQTLTTSSTIDLSLAADSNISITPTTGPVTLTGDVGQYLDELVPSEVLDAPVGSVDPNNDSKAGVNAINFVAWEISPAQESPASAPQSAESAGIDEGLVLEPLAEATIVTAVGPMPASSEPQIVTDQQSEHALSVDEVMPDMPDTAGELELELEAPLAAVVESPVHTSAEPVELLETSSQVLPTSWPTIDQPQPIEPAQEIGEADELSPVIAEPAPVSLETPATYDVIAADTISLSLPEPAEILVEHPATASERIEFAALAKPVDEQEVPEALPLEEEELSLDSPSLAVPWQSPAVVELDTPPGEPLVLDETAAPQIESLAPVEMVTEQALPWDAIDLEGPAPTELAAPVEDFGSNLELNASPLMPLAVNEAELAQTTHAAEEILADPTPAPPPRPPVVQAEPPITSPPLLASDIPALAEPIASPEAIARSLNQPIANLDLVAESESVLKIPEPAEVFIAFDDPAPEAKPSDLAPTTDIPAEDMPLELAEELSPLPLPELLSDPESKDEPDTVYDTMPDTAHDTMPDILAHALPESSPHTLPEVLPATPSELDEHLSVGVFTEDHSLIAATEDVAPTPPTISGSDEELELEPDSMLAAPLELLPEAESAGVESAMPLAPPLPPASAPAQSQPPMISGAVIAETDPFLGMSRDAGLFLGGMPLDLSIPLFSAPQLVPPPVTSRPAIPPASIFAPASQTLPAVSTPEVAPDIVTAASVEPLAEESLGEILAKEGPKEELFDATPESLDSLPEDSMHPIDDVVEVLGEKPPGVPEPQSPTSPANGPKVPPLHLPPRPRMTGCGRSANPFDFGAQSGVEIAIPPFGSGTGGTAAAPANRNAPSGKSLDPFGQPIAPHAAEIPPADSAELNQAGLPSLSGGVTKSSQARFGRDVASRSGRGVPTTSESPAVPLSPFRKAPARGASPSPRFDGLPPMPPKAPLNLHLRIVLPIVAILAGMTSAAIWFGVHVSGSAEGRLGFENVANLSPADLRHLEAEEQQRMLAPGFRETARGIFQSRTSGQLPDGFLGHATTADEAAYSNIVSSAAFAPGSKDLTLSVTSSDPKGDQQRLAAMILALYEATRTQTDQAGSAKAAYETAEQALDAATAKIAQLTPLVASERIATAQLDSAVATYNQAKEQLADLTAQCKVAADKLFASQAAVDNLDTTAAGGTGENAAQQQDSVIIDNDPQLKLLSDQLAADKATLARSRSQRSAASDTANKALDKSLADFRQSVAAAQSSLKNGSQLAAYLSAAQQAQETLRQINDDLVDREKSQEQRLTDLRRVVEEKQEARLKSIWAADPTLQGLAQDLEVAEHRYNAAVGSGLDADAAQLKKEVDDLKNKIDARRDLIGAGDMYADEVKLLQQFVDQSLKDLENERSQADARMGEMLKSLAKTAPQIDQLPADQQALAQSLQKQLADIDHARQLQAQAIAQATPESDPDVTKLEDAITQLQAKLDARRKDLADSSHRALSASQQQDRAAKLDAAKAALATAQTQYADASAAVQQKTTEVDADYTRVEDLRAKAAELKTDNAELNELQTSLPDLQNNKDRLLTAWHHIAIPENPGVGGATRATNVNDPRLQYILISTLAYAFATVGMLAVWGVSHRRHHQMLTDHHRYNHPDDTAESESVAQEDSDNPAMADVLEERSTGST